MALPEFLRMNEKAILTSTEAKSLQLAGAGPSSQQMKRGLPIFFNQLLDVLEQAPPAPADSVVDNEGMIKAAFAADEPAIAVAAGRPYEAEVAKSAGAYGTELHKLGYTLSHVVARKWEDLALMFTAKGLRKFPIEYFEPSQMAQARAWLAAH